MSNAGHLQRISLNGQEVSGDFHDIPITGDCVIIEQNGYSGGYENSNGSRILVSAYSEHSGVPNRFSSVDILTNSSALDSENKSCIVMKHYVDKSDGSFFSRARETVVDYAAQKIYLYRMQQDGTWQGKTIDLWAVAQ